MSNGTRKRDAPRTINNRPVKLNIVTSEKQDQLTLIGSGYKLKKKPNHWAHLKHPGNHGNVTKRASSAMRRLRKVSNNSSVVGNKSVTKSDKPVTKSEKPVTKSDKPVTKSEKPVTKSDKSVTKSDKPVTKSDQSVTKSDKPVTKSDKPVTKSEKSVIKSDKSVTKSDIKPVTKSDKLPERSKSSQSTILGPPNRPLQARKPKNPVPKPTNKTPKPTDKMPKKCKCHTNTTDNSESAADPPTSESAADPPSSEPLSDPLTESASSSMGSSVIDHIAKQNTSVIDHTEHPPGHNDPAPLPAPAPPDGPPSHYDWEYRSPTRHDHSHLPLTSPTLVRIESTNSSPIIKHLDDPMSHGSPHGARQSISSLSPSQQREVRNTAAALEVYDEFTGTHRSQKKLNLWNILNLDCNVNGQTYKKLEKQLLFIRHAEGYHNSLFEEKKIHEAINIRDPELTRLGNLQVADLHKEVDILIKSGVKIEKVIVSPMTRTLQTGWGTFSGQNIPFQACHLISEYADAPCNYGTRKSQLEKMWPQVDFSMVPEVWWNEDESDATITKRAKAFREWLFKQPEKHMAIVSHAGFLHELLQEHFRNCELKRINWVHRSRRQAKKK